MERKRHHEFMMSVHFIAIAHRERVCTLEMSSSKGGCSRLVARGDEDEIEDNDGGRRDV